jgi:hypothetical protein
VKPSSRPYLLAVFAAIIMAFISAHYLWHGDIRNTIPWGLLSLACGLLAASKTMAWKLGGICGFAVSYWFLWFDNTDPLSFHQFVQLFLLIPLPSLFGAVCGALLGRLAFSIKQLSARTNR